MLAQYLPGSLFWLEFTQTTENLLTFSTIFRSISIYSKVFHIKFYWLPNYSFLEVADLYDLETLKFLHLQQQLIL